MTTILGVNAYHSDSSACLVINGELVAAAEEERFRRVKHWAGFPSEAIRYCLDEGGIRLADINIVAVNQDASANILRKVLFMATQHPDISLILDRIKNKRKRVSIAEEFTRTFPNESFSAEVRYVEHHLSHLASAFFVSPYEDAVVLSVDGFGDFASSAWGVGRGSTLDVEDRIYFPHSLGIFYMALTQYLGFLNWGDEYKVMGLAPYGKLTFIDEMRKVVQLQKDGRFTLRLKFFRHHKEKVEDQWANGKPRVGVLYSPALEALLGPARKKEEPLTQHHWDIARSIQGMYEEAFFHLLNHLYDRHKIDSLALAGGCAMNSVANGRIYKNTPFRKIYIPPASGDAGGAIGAAFLVAADLGHMQQHFQMNHAYWGPGYSNAYIKQLLEKEKESFAQMECTVSCIEDEVVLIRETAEALSHGLVVGWFQGRMEWGPRALGNRSILADPRRTNMKDILNLKIKRRESFRPFAPSILRERVSEWFEIDDEVPFMMQVYQVCLKKRLKIPAVVHADGSGRLQTVCKHTNPRYYRLIKCFHELTGVPIVLNTSFNENEPIVCTPKEALDCFLRTKMDVLVLGDYLIKRNNT